MDCSVSEAGVATGPDGPSAEAILERLEAALGRCLRAVDRLGNGAGSLDALRADARRAIAELDRLLDRADG